MKTIVFIFSFIVITAISVPASECSIVLHRDEFRKSKAVFIGEVVKIENQTAEDREENGFFNEWKNEFMYSVTLKVIKSWKGSKKEKKIWIHMTHDLRKWKFEIGRKYLIYAHKYKGLLIGADNCNRTIREAIGIPRRKARAPRCFRGDRPNRRTPDGTAPPRSRAAADARGNSPARA